jgi:hypothetical protein
MHKCPYTPGGNALVFVATGLTNATFNLTVWGVLVVPKLNSRTCWSSANVLRAMSNSWTLICACIISIKICLSKCGKLNEGPLYRLLH